MKAKRENNRIFGGAWLLSVAALSGKFLSVVYRIPLTRILGMHGMGLYQSVFPMYALLVILTGGGLTAAVSKLTAESEGEFSCRTAVIFSLIFSLPVTAVAMLCARFIAATAGAPEATAALWMLLPSVPVSAVCAVLRGYFQGQGNMMPSAVGQLVEQIAKLAMGLTLSFVLLRVSLYWAVAGCAAGVTFSEIAAVLYYRTKLFRLRKAATMQPQETLPALPESRVHTQGVREKEQAQSTQESAAVLLTADVEMSAELAPTLSAVGEVSDADISEQAPSSNAVAQAENAVAVPHGLRAFFERLAHAFAGRKTAFTELLKLSLPITLGVLVLPLCQVADSFLVVNLLTHSGMPSENATSVYGLVTGPIGSLINMPAVFTVGLCSMLLPKVSMLRRRGEPIGKSVLKAMALSAAAGVLFFAALALFASPALTVLYGRNLGLPLHDAVLLLRMASVSVLCMTVTQTITAVLQGCGKAYLPVCNLLLAAVIKEVLNCILLPKWGIYGFVIASDAFYAIACIGGVVALWITLRGARKTERKKGQKDIAK